MGTPLFHKKENMLQCIKFPSFFFLWKETCIKFPFFIHGKRVIKRSLFSAHLLSFPFLYGPIFFLPFTTLQSFHLLPLFSIIYSLFYINFLPSSFHPHSFFLHVWTNCCKLQPFQNFESMEPNRELFDFNNTWFSGMWSELSNYDQDHIISLIVLFFIFYDFLHFGHSYLLFWVGFVGVLTGNYWT